MFITIKAQLMPPKETEKQLMHYGQRFKQEIFRICNVFKRQGSTFEFRYKNISNDISWESKGLVLQKAKEMYNANVRGKLINLNFSSLWSPRSFSIDKNNHMIRFILGRNSIHTSLSVPIYWNTYVNENLIQKDIISLRLCYIKGKWSIFITLEKHEPVISSKKEMGIDIGVKVPAVVCTEDMKIRFFGNGRQIRYNQRRYRSKYQALQAIGNHKKMSEMNHKLHHIMNDCDHKIAKLIIIYAQSQDIGVIKMERLKHINKKFDIKLESHIYLWSYRRLQDLIEYKAKLNGIRIIYVNPYNTSKCCPDCGKLNFPKDRIYMCRFCGYKNHRDIVGAINIMRAL